MTALSVPTVMVNGEPVGIKPNSFSFTEGFGTRTTRMKSTGGGSKVIINTRNIETEFSVCKFTLLSEDISASRVREWLSKGDTNVVRAVEGTFQRTFNQAHITNDPEAALGVEGDTPLEWASKPAV